jgi:uncharacterized membrane protein YcgQ (UPF0703/DUF1980 family)
MAFFFFLIKTQVFGIIRKLICLSIFLFNLFYYYLSRFLKKVIKKIKDAKNAATIFGNSPDFFKGTVQWGGQKKCTLFEIPVFF